MRLYVCSWFLFAWVFSLYLCTRVGVIRHGGFGGRALWFDDVLYYSVVVGI